MSDSHRKSKHPSFAWRRQLCNHAEDINTTGRITRALRHRVRSRTRGLRSEITPNEMTAWCEFRHRHRLSTYRSQAGAAWHREVDRCAQHTARSKAIREEVGMWLDDIAADREEQERLDEDMAEECGALSSAHACTDDLGSHYGDNDYPRYDEDEEDWY